MAWSTLPRRSPVPPQFRNAELNLLRSRADRAFMAGHATLHDARTRKNLSLAELSSRTSLSPAVVRKIDEGRFGELPPGLYARSYVRSFAGAVGLDPAETLKEVEHLLPGAPDPLPVMRELKGPTVTNRVTAAFNRMRLRDDCAEATTEVGQPEAHHDPEPEQLEHPAFRTQLVRVGVAVVDAVVLLGMNGALLLVIALSTGLPPASLLRQSAALSALCAVPTVLYFVLFNGIAGRTLGGWLCRMPEPGPHPPLTLDAILRRSLALGSSLDEHRDGLSSHAFVGRG